MRRKTWLDCWVVAMTYNVLQIDVGGLLKLPLSIRTNVYIEDKCLLARYKIKTRFSAQLFRTER